MQLVVQVMFEGSAFFTGLMMETAPHSVARAGWLLIPQDTGLRAVLTQRREGAKETTGGLLVKKVTPGVIQNITPLCGAAESQPLLNTRL